MDPLSTAASVVTVLGPFLPFLTSLGKSVHKKLEDVIAEKGGNVVWNQAQAIWKKIKERFQDDKEIEGATAAMSADPDNQMFQQMMVQVLTKKLEADPSFAAELLKLMGGEAGVQRAIAGDEAKMERIRQMMKDAGQQEARAGNKSTLTNIDQIMGYEQIPPSDRI